MQQCVCRHVECIITPRSAPPLKIVVLPTPIVSIWLLLFFRSSLIFGTARAIRLLFFWLSFIVERIKGSFFRLNTHPPYMSEWCTVVVVCIVYPRTQWIINFQKSATYSGRVLYSKGINVIFFILKYYVSFLFKISDKDIIQFKIICFKASDVIGIRCLYIWKLKGKDPNYENRYT